MRVAPGQGPLQLWRRTRRRPDQVALVPLAGGAGAFIARSRLVSLLEPPGPNSAWPHRLLERMQTRRSRLLVATEREVAIACVRRWNVDLARVRLVPDLDQGLETGLASELERRVPGRAAWHSAH